MGLRSGRIWRGLEAAGRKSCWRISSTRTGKCRQIILATPFETTEGESYSGLIVNETASSVTVRQPLGVEVVVARAQIAQMQASKLSLMPEGLEEGLTSRDLADLMDFIFGDVQ